MYINTFSREVLRSKQYWEEDTENKEEDTEKNLK